MDNQNGFDTFYRKCQKIDINIYIYIYIYIYHRTMSSYHVIVPYIYIYNRYIVDIKISSVNSVLMFFVRACYIMVG